MYKDSEYIRFDWAIKRILRDKANFGVLEGLMTVLINTDIKILEVLESESNRDSAEDKSNRVDVKAKTADGEIVLIDVQLARESHF
ncbi:MAG: PD-(D/E)XK nuclease family transposase, partial [Bacteroidaceae bacterium]|nr:PD-(D/E)XK nuclease family transposase [Bacteroidaceae bacterium]